MKSEPARELATHLLAFALGLFSFIVVLAAHHFADGDLWGKLAIGAHVWKHGTVPARDLFAFTPVLPNYTEHEWGAGVIFYGVLMACGPAGLMTLKLVLATGAVLGAMGTGRRLDCKWETLLLLAIPAAACIMPGYIPVLRSHTFTYCFFAVTLLGLEDLRAGRRWPMFLLPPLMTVWSNVHGGFVAGLGAILVYTFCSLCARQRFERMLTTALLCCAATLVNIYGLRFWTYLVPALLNPRPRIAEWQPLPLFASDAFLGFRVLFLLVAVLLLVAWRRTEKKSWPGLILLGITAALAWRSRRHAPFFGVATLAFAGPFLQTALALVAARMPQRWRASARPALVVAVVHGALAIGVATLFLPDASFQVLAPVGHDPVREADVLSRARAEGNLATPFQWGCYCSWRLYPRIRVSMDGRYETTYPESTFELNDRFYDKRGAHWDQLIRDYRVDYIILDFREGRLRPSDLTDHGYVLIWLTEGRSALMALQARAGDLERAAAALPPATIDPLDPRIPDAWWPR